MKALDWISAVFAFLLIFVGVSFLLRTLNWFAGWSEIIAAVCGGHSAYWTVRSLRSNRKAKRLQIEAERRGRNVCPRCEYDLTGNTSGRCPECGAVLASASTDG
jgi:ribosomal protein L37AE/L43A